VFLHKAGPALLSLTIGVTGCAVDIVDSNDAGSAGATPVTGPIVGMPLATFATDIEGFRLDTYPEATNLASTSNPMLTWDMTEGSPDPGCLKITVPYSAANQYIDLESPVFTAPLPDWTGKTLHVRLKVADGGTFKGSPSVYVKTGTAFVYYPMTFATTTIGSTWVEFKLPLVSPAPVPPATMGADASQVITYGIHPTPGSSPSSTPGPVTFFVDSFSIE
jgi:hypothetical protein